MRKVIFKATLGKNVYFEQKDLKPHDEMSSIS
jgi:hypothetical protein